MNNKRTSRRIGKIAAKALSDNNSSKIQRQLSGSLLVQILKDKHPSPEIETKAGKVLKSRKYSALSKVLAASIVAQSTK